MNRPVNALVVGNTEPLAWCSLHEDWVAESQIVMMHGGRGREPKGTCIPCMFHTAEAWRETGCPFCVMTADRVQGAIEAYMATGQPITLPEVPSEELPAHSPDCRFAYDVLPGQPT